MSPKNNKILSQQTGKCPCCGSKDLDYITRVTGYFTRVSTWNRGKIAELKDRNREVNKKFFS